MRTLIRQFTPNSWRFVGLRIVNALLLAAVPLQGVDAWDGTPADSHRGARLVLATDGMSTLPAVARAVSAALSEATGMEVVDGAPDGTRPVTATIRLRGDVTAYRLTARVVAVEDGRMMMEETVTGGQGQVFDLIDDLALRLRRSPGLRARRGIAVLPFDNHAGPSSAPFVSGIQQMLMTSLRQDAELTLIEPADMAGAPEEAVKAGRWAGAEAVIDGSFTDVIRIEATAMSGSGRDLGTHAVEGPRPDRQRLVADLVAQVAEAVKKHRSEQQTVAVLRFENHGDERYTSFVDGMADMLTTGLGGSTRLRVIERTQIEKAMANFHVEMSGPIDAETAVQVGDWLGADAVVIGSFLRFGDVFRIDARMIDARTGEVTIAESVRGAESDVMGLVDELGDRLLARVESTTPVQAEGTGTVRVVFRATKSEMGERPVYHHICKLYVDGKYVDMSRPLTHLDKWETLFERPLRAGPHRIEIVHGFVRGRDWDGRMPTQPAPFEIVVEADAVTTVQYEFEVGWFEDTYTYQ